MTWWKDVLAGVGGLAVLAAVLAAAAVGWSALVEVLDARRRRFRREGAEHERQLLAGDARWFSEDPETMWLLERFARGSDVDAVREEWRRRRQARAEGSCVCDSCGQIHLHNAPGEPREERCQKCGEPLGWSEVRP